MKAIEVFEALSNETRLEAFRLLVRAGPEGLAAGEIAEELGVVQNTMSTHLHKLTRAGILRRERHSRHIIYNVEFDTVQGLVLFLLEDCCGSSAAVCAPVARSLTA
jgi:DNA-binding transcriptional ArsR family regulator